MATVEKIAYTHPSPMVDAAFENITWGNGVKGPTLYIPQIFWRDCTPWREANMWVIWQIKRGAKKVETALSAIGHLRAFAAWLEERGMTWTHFPEREDQRCLTIYRGHLISQRESEQLMPSTVSARMSSVLRFYRWVMRNGLIVADQPLWKDKSVLVQLDHKYGMRRSVLVTSSELSIPNSGANLLTLEGGVIPVSVDVSQRIVSFASRHGSPEIALLLRTGFGTGMRVSTVLSLRERTVERAAPHPSFRGWFTIAVGPTGAVPVDTKFGRSGEILVPSAAIEALRSYIRSPRRLLRIALAKAEDRDLIFLTKSGRPFGNSSSKSMAMNTQISRLRKKAADVGESCLVGFNFHRARATFGTELAKAALKHGGITFAIWLVKNALMHKSEKDTLRYIKFVQSISILEETSDQFSHEFFGMLP